MKKITLVILFILSVFCLSGCTDKISTVQSSDSLYVSKVENISKDFMSGMDISSIISLENAGVKFYTQDGVEEDIFKILAENGINYIRVRVWNDPYDSNGNSYGGGNCDINNAIEIGKRATKYGMKLFVDFHYSDFWADPSKQMVPKAWKNMDPDEKAEALYTYTYDCLTKLKDAKVDVGMVSLGNETTSGLAGEKTWFNICKLMISGSKAVRAVDPNILIALHVTNPEKEGSYLGIAKKFAYYNVDYDVFASSYYPYWHGTLDNLAKVLNEITETYGKKTLVAETSYCFTGEDTDYFGNTVYDSSAFDVDYPFTIQGQANFIRDLIDTIANKMTSCLGLFYWEGAWITCGGSSLEENQILWEKYGCGWATSASKEYDPDDAGKYYGGSAVDNQAFFDANGKALESLKVFSLVKKGNVIETKPDAIANTQIVCDLAGDINIPTKVNAIMTDGSLKELDVTWETINIDELRAGGAKRWTFTGQAGGMTATLVISMIEYNYLTNYSFEDDSNATAVPSGWSVTDLSGGKCEEIYVETKSTDSLTGVNHFHYWSGTKDTVEFKLEQETSTLEAGTYKFSISIMGSDSGDYTCYAYALVNGIEVGRAELKINGYSNWYNDTVNDIEIKSGDTLTVGIYVKCSGDGSGAWGKIDDGLLNRVS